MKPMAHVVVVDDTNTPVWTGNLKQFFRDNSMDRADARRICEELRPSDTSHLSEPVFIGGGAGVEFKLQLFDERVRPRRRCAHGGWQFACLKCNAPVFDYDLQVWTRGGVIVNCGHPFAMNCGCNAKKYAGWTVKRAHQEVAARRRVMEAVTGINQRATAKLIRGLNWTKGMLP